MGVCEVEVWGERGGVMAVWGMCVRWSVMQVMCVFVLHPPQQKPLSSTK